MIEDQRCTDGIVSAGKVVGDGHIAATFVNEAFAIGIDENSFVDEGIQARIGPEAIIAERFARDQMA